jgi:tRNA modification GTPase
MNFSETICAISTPPGPGGIGVIRISGGGSICIVDRVFLPSSKVRLEQSTSHTVHHGYLIDPATQERIDEVLVTLFRRPKSYTRENVVEISLHGGPLILNRALGVVIRAGARPANPGEFTLRAFLNGRLDLTQAEAVMEMISAQTEQGRRAAMAQLRGALSETLRPLYREIIDLLAHIEASIDFSEEGITFDSDAEIIRRVKAVLQKVNGIYGSYRIGRLQRDGAKTVLVGRPNVGKSSLMNALLGEKRAIVTPVPGTTRDIIQEQLSLDGITLRVCDMAGVSVTDDPVEREGVRIAESALNDADLALLVLDNNAPLHPEDHSLIDRVMKRKAVVVLNKSDLPARFPLKWIQDALPACPVVTLSALTGDGVDRLKESIRRILLEEVDLTEGGAITQARHAEALLSCGQALERALSAAQRGLSWEFLAVDLEVARQKIGYILGEGVPEEVIDAIFRRFCIGK